MPAVTPTCPPPITTQETILLGHGSGGKLTARLIESVFAPIFGSACQATHDGAFLTLGNQLYAFSTDSYVVRPLFFPGGDIGCLAVNGTINDLAMCGAQPLYLSCSFILEEGLAQSQLVRIVESMQTAAQKTGTHLVTGDTKVVERGKGDGVYINTTGIGAVTHDPIHPGRIEPGDAILVSGAIGRHGMAILSQREGLTFDSVIESDTQELYTAVSGLLSAGVPIRCLRDLTRGGLATALVEIADTIQRPIYIDEPSVPIDDTVRGACEFLGLDPLYSACEGRFAAFMPSASAAKALEILRSFDPDSRWIGRVGEETGGKVIATTFLGTRRILEKLTGDPFPRIC